jgi:hypothetical protein
MGGTGSRIGGEAGLGCPDRSQLAAVVDPDAQERAMDRYVATTRWPMCPGGRRGTRARPPPASWWGTSPPRLCAPGHPGSRRRGRANRSWPRRIRSSPASGASPSPRRPWSAASTRVPVGSRPKRSHPETRSATEHGRSAEAFNPSRTWPTDAPSSENCQSFSRRRHPGRSGGPGVDVSRRRTSGDGARRRTRPSMRRSPRKPE